MKKTKIKFEDIKAGDLIEAVLVDGGVKCVVTGIAFQLETINEGWDDAHTFWSTSEGSMVVAKNEYSLKSLHRIDVSETKFEDIRAGDLIRVTSRTGTITQIVEDRVVSYVSAFPQYWVNSNARPVISRIKHPEEEREIEILERDE